jgi:hypothetical protein
MLAGVGPLDPPASAAAMRDAGGQVTRLSSQSPSERTTGFEPANLQLGKLAL